MLTVSNSTTGKGYSGYFAMTGSGNSGYAGYFIDTGTGATGYAIYASGSNYLGGTTTVAGAFNTTSTNVLGGTTTITGTLNQTGNAVLSGTTTISTGALNITSNAILSGTTTFTGAMNATGLSSGTIASGKFIGLNSSNQLVLASASAGATIALSSITSAQATNSEDNATYAQTWTWNTISTQTGLTISTTAALTGGTLVSLSDSAASSTSTGKILSISNSTTGAGYDGYSTMTATGNQGYAIYATNTGPNNKGYAIYGLNNSTSGWGEYQAGSSPNYFDGWVGIGTAAPEAVLDIDGGSTQDVLKVNGTASPEIEPGNIQAAFDRLEIGIPISYKQLHNAGISAQIQCHLPTNTGGQQILFSNIARPERPTMLTLSGGLRRHRDDKPEPSSGSKWQRSGRSVAHILGQ